MSFSTDEGTESPSEILADELPDVATNSQEGTEPTKPTTTPTLPTPAGTPFATAFERPHGTGVRGLNLSRQSVQFEGRFGRMFRTVRSASHDVEDLQQLAAAMEAEPEDTPTSEMETDDEENTGLSAGYTYFGQFLDHDLTFDPASSLQRQDDPDGLTDYRTPRFDLDCLYGRGPDDQPYLYADDGIHMLLGRSLSGSIHDLHARDVPRNQPSEGGQDAAPRRALIGDPRNDENVIVSQLQATMLRFHNRMADILAQQDSSVHLTFERVQQEVRFHYQWVILHDFLLRIIGNPLLNTILPLPSKDGDSEDKDDKNGLAFHPNLRFFKWKNDPYIPVEFSVAAYRFGHSMVRPIYRLNTTLSIRQSIFGTEPSESLTGFRAFPDSWAVDWNLFFRMEDNQPLAGPERLQHAYKIDTSLVNPLAHLPPSVVKATPSLATRNLERGLRMSLPSGQAVARAMGLDVIPDAELRVGKATEASQETNPLLTDISPKFAGNAPLWYYILAEAQREFRDNENPLLLGPVGGRIVGEVFVGLLWGDSHSYLRQDPSWQPRKELMHNGHFGIAELIRAARKDVPPAPIVNNPPQSW